MIGAMFDRSIEPEPCGAQDWGWWDDGRHIVLYGTCRRPKGHTSKWHAEWSDSGQLLAEWSGSRDRRAPTDAPLWEPPVEAVEP